MENGQGCRVVRAGAGMAGEACGIVPLPGRRPAACFVAAVLSFCVAGGGGGEQAGDRPRPCPLPIPSGGPGLLGGVVTISAVGRLVEVSPMPSPFYTTDANDATRAVGPGPIRIVRGASSPPRGSDPRGL